MKKKGDVLEVIVKEIETQLADNEDTIIQRNYEIIDRDGFDREIDIYCETKVNKRILKYAIECKNYGEKSFVKMSDIDTFYSKIANQGIKGIFLSTGKFQKNAIKKAHKLNIEVYTIIDAKDCPIERIELSSKRYEIKDIKYYSYPIAATDLSKEKTIYAGEQKKKFNRKTVLLYIREMLDGILHKDFHGLYNNLYNSDWRQEGKKEFIYEGQFAEEMFFIKKEGEFYPITHFVSSLSFWLEEYQFNLEGRKVYKSITNQLELAKFISVKIDLNNDVVGYLNFIWVEDEEEPQMRVISERGELISTFSTN